MSPKTQVYASYINGAVGEAIRDYFNKRLGILGVLNTPVTGLTEAASKGVHRISGTVTSKDNNLFRVETMSVIGPKFVIGLTADETNLKSTLENVLEWEVPQFFDELVETSVKMILLYIIRS